MVGYGTQIPESLEARTDGYERQARGSGRSARFTIYDLSGQEPEPVGTTSLHVDHAVRNAEYIIMIGEAGHRGRGLGTDATRLTLDYAFHICQIRAVWLKVLEHNTAAIRAYEKAGFKHAGRRRRAGYWLGEVCDEILMDAIPEDFMGPSLVKQLANEAR